MSDSTTTAPPNQSTEAPPNQSTEAPPNQSTEAPPNQSTEAPPNQSTEAPPNQSTEAPPNQSTEAPAGPSGSSTTTTTAPLSGATGNSAPSVEATIEIDPSDGSAQSPTSYQVPTTAELILTWNATNAASVNISGLGDGQSVAGSSAIPTQDGSFTLIAVGDDGSQSPPLVISVSTHDPAEVVSPHSEISSGAAVILSFAAMKDGQVITHASVGDEITLSAVVSESTDSITIAGAPAGLAGTADGNGQATATVTITEGMSGDFSCDVSAGGTAGGSGSVHLDIGPSASGGSTTTTAAPGFTTTAPSSTSPEQPGSTTTAAEGDKPEITLQIVNSKGAAPEENEPVEVVKGQNAATITWQISNQPKTVTITGQPDGMAAGSMSFEFKDGIDGEVVTFAASNDAGNAETKTVSIKYVTESDVEVSIAELGASVSGSADLPVPDPFKLSIGLACEGTFNLMMVTGNEAQQTDVRTSAAAKLANCVPSTAIIASAQSGTMSGGWSLSGFKGVAKGSGGEWTVAQFQIGKYAFTIPEFEGKGNIEVASVTLTASAFTLSLKEGDAMLAPVQGTLEIPLIASTFDLGVKGFRLDGKIAVKVTLTGSVGLKEIIEKSAEDELLEALKDGAIFVGIDALIAGAFVLGGVAAIGAAILTIEEGDEIAAISGRCTEVANQMSAGYAAGVQGQPSPANDPATLKGYNLGAQNYNAAVADITSKNQSADAQAIKDAVAKAAAQNQDKAAATIKATAQRTVWESYANNHMDTLFHSYESDRWMAWSNIYSFDPNGDPEYMKFQNNHSENKHGMYAGGTKTDHTGGG